jgi:alpha-beta hydrolase superfamily lysophospholipase
MPFADKRLNGFINLFRIMRRFGGYFMKITGITYVPRKTHKIKGFFIFLLIFILVIGAATMGYSAIVGWQLTHPERESLSAYTSGSIPVHSEVNFTASDNVKLKGWLFASPGSNKTVILAHGYGKSRLQFGAKTFNMISSFTSNGYNVLAFDFRNSGVSSGNLTSVGVYEKKDLLAAIKFAKSKGSKHVVLMGFSMGASTSITAAVAARSDVDAVIADSPFADLNGYLNENLPVWSHLPAVPFNSTILFSIEMMTGIDPASVSPVTDIRKFSPKPVLLIHSRDDSKIPYENSQDLADAYHDAGGTDIWFWDTTKADHVGSYEMYTQEYMDKVFNFLDSVKMN